jgi:hypothetical protein
MYIWSSGATSERVINCYHPVSRILTSVSLVLDSSHLVIKPVSPRDFRVSNRDVNVRLHPRNESFARGKNGDFHQTSAQHGANMTTAVQSEVSDNRFLVT